jgi:hypothetical protein
MITLRDDSCLIKWCNLIDRYLIPRLRNYQSHKTCAAITWCIWMERLENTVQLTYLTFKAIGFGNSDPVKSQTLDLLYWQYIHDGFAQWYFSYNMKCFLLLLILFCIGKRVTLSTVNPIYMNRSHKFCDNIDLIKYTGTYSHFRKCYISWKIGGFCTCAMLSLLLVEAEWHIYIILNF